MGKTGGPLRRKVFKTLYKNFLNNRTEIIRRNAYLILEV